VFDEKGKFIKECDDRTEAWALSMTKSGWSFRRQMLPKDFANSDFSPVHDRPGPRQRMFESGIPAERISASSLTDNQSSEASEDWRNY